MDPLITSLMSGDNNVRRNAEVQFQELRKQPDNLISGMMQSLTTSPQPDVCQSYLFTISSIVVFFFFFFFFFFSPLFFWFSRLIT